MGRSWAVLRSLGRSIGAVGLGLLAVGLILFEHRDLRLAILLAIAIWSFCRAYYFAFYVIQHYVDPSYRFAGLGSFVAYLFRQRADRADKNGC